MNWLLMILLITLILAACLLGYLTSQLVALDATARGLARPKLLAFLAAGSQNGSGLLAYLALRRGHPLDSRKDRPQRREQLKIASIGLFAVLLVTAICSVLVLIMDN
ncbi:hypothetical protein [Lapidilactobacillus luobeiensis]|uniref:hypothetical protein n=1 Tax=Lapidilactobacillus luobeiensis TaxID=2950371 RepID=UPI0021C330AC|nr:hypothetical protein [Lapidilactobacillus luobeiensis]